MLERDLVFIASRDWQLTTDTDTPSTNISANKIEIAAPATGFMPAFHRCAHALEAGDDLIQRLWLDLLHNRRRLLGL